MTLAGVAISGYVLLKTAHVLAVGLWVGGMAFAHFFLRPALPLLPPPQRLALMDAVLGRFLRAVQWALLVLLASGFWMFGRVAAQMAQAGTGWRPPHDWTLMTVLGLVMAAVFVAVRWWAYPRLHAAVAAQDWPAGAAALARVRQGVAFNLALGLLVVLVALVF